MSKRIVHITGSPQERESPGSQPAHQRPPSARLVAERLARLARYFSPRRHWPLPAVAGNDVRLLINGNEIFSAMLSAILTARRSIDLEMYIWRADSIGRRFAALLKAKSAEGVRVRVIYDSFGCWQEPRSFWREMAEAGIQVAEFNPLAHWRMTKAVRRFFRHSTVGHRDHRKILLIDGQTGFVGGGNIGDEYVGEGHDPRHWRDTCVQARGPVVAGVESLFDRQWQRVTGLPSAMPSTPPSTLPTAKQTSPPVPHPVAEDGQGSTGSAGSAGSHLAFVLGSRPGWPNPIRQSMLTAVRRARKQIEITMAYFVPPPRLIWSLRRAARRGVKVRLVLPSRSDVPLVLHAGRWNYTALLRAGAEIYECLGTVLHAKTIQVDGLWATVGSANLDRRSFRRNDEINMFVLGRDFAGQLHQVFLADVARSRQIQLAEWKGRPWPQKLKEWLCRLFRAWM